MTVFHLARRGYGTIEEIESWDTPRFLDIVEYEKIQRDLEQHAAEGNK